MFESVAPGYYAKYYNLASEFTHPGWGSNAFKMTRTDDGRGFIDQGVVFKSDRFTSSFNELVVLILGFLRVLAILFPSSDWTPTTVLNWETAVSKLQETFDSHIAFKGGPNDWHRLTEPLTS